MITRKTRLAACVALLFGLAGGALAQTPAGGTAPPDSRVVGAVKALGYEHEVSKTGLVTVLIPFSESKARPVMIESQTQYTGSTETRVVFSIARIYDGPVPPSAYDLIREANEKNPFGTFLVIDTDDGKHFVVYSLRVKADATPQELGGSIKTVCGVAATMSVALGRGA